MGAGGIGGGGRRRRAKGADMSAPKLRGSAQLEAVRQGIAAGAGVSEEQGFGFHFRAERQANGQVKLTVTSLEDRQRSFDPYARLFFGSDNYVDAGSDFREGVFVGRI